MGWSVVGVGLGVNLDKQGLSVRPGQRCFWRRHKVPVDAKCLPSIFFHAKPNVADVDAKCLKYIFHANPNEVDFGVKDCDSM